MFENNVGECLCVAVAAGVLGAMVLNRHGAPLLHGPHPAPTECSARAADVSARAATTDDGGDDLWQLESVLDDEDAPGTQRPLTRAGKANAERSLPGAQTVETTYSRSLGVLIPRIGCTIATKPPKATGSMWFGAPEAYADASAGVDTHVTSTF